MERRLGRVDRDARVSQAGVRELARVNGAVIETSIEQNAKAEAIKSIKAKKLNVSRPGEMLTAISYLKEADEVETVEKLYKQLIKKYESTYVYYEKYARFAQKMKSAEKALILAEQASKYPQGNEPQLGLLRSQILVDLNRKDEAMKAIDQTLQVGGIEHARYARVVKKLNDMKNELKESFGKK